MSSPLRVLVAGLAPHLKIALKQGFPDLDIQAEEQGRRALDRVLSSPPDLLLLDHGLKQPSAIKLLEYLANHPSLSKAKILYLLERAVPQSLPSRLVEQLRVDRILYHPIELTELCHTAALLLNIAQPTTLPRDSRESCHGSTRGDSQGPLIWVLTEDHDLLADVVPGGKARRFRSAVFSQQLTIEDELPLAVLVDARGDVLDLRIEQMEELRDFATQPSVVALVEDDLESRVTVAKAGAARVVTTPTEVAVLLETVEEVLDESREEQLKVLLVDADPTLAADLQWLMTRNGFRTQTIGDSEQFWDSLESFYPDLLVLGTDPDGYSGTELCRAVRADSRWRELPVILLVDTVEKRRDPSYFWAGADDVISRPVDHGELLTRVGNRLSRYRANRTSELDPLTQTMTRRRATPILRRLLRMATRRRVAFSLAMVDIDHFKSINDKWGHPTGDEVLRQLGRMLNHTFRHEDVVARWGGEEFMVGLFGMNAEVAQRRIERCLRRVQAHVFQSPEAEFRVTFSAGLCERSQNLTTLAELIACADEALYAAKQGGRAQVALAGLVHL